MLFLICPTSDGISPFTKADHTSTDLLTTPSIHPTDILSHPDYFGVKGLVTMEDLFNARVHLGHKTGMWNPLMKPYIYGSRTGIHILNLSHTLELLHKALNVTAHIAYREGITLFVNERPQFEGLIQRTARECGEYFVTQRWRGGTFTNSHMLLGTMRLPDLMIFTSVPPSKTAIKEAAMACVPSIGVVDSDCNPNLIMYPVPGNDDTPCAIRLYCRLFSEAIQLGKSKRKAEMENGQVDSGIVCDSEEDGKKL